MVWSSSALPTRPEASREFINQIGVQNQCFSFVSQFSGTRASMEGESSRFTNRISLKTLSNVVLNKPSFLEFKIFGGFNITVSEHRGCEKERSGVLGCHSNFELLTLLLIESDSRSNTFVG